MLSLSRSHPGILKTFLYDIISNNKVSFLKDTTIIITVYELNVNEVVILYKVLKELRHIKAVEKVINKKEFLIVGVYSSNVMEYFNNPNKWYILALKKALDEMFTKTNSLVYYLNPPEKNCDMAIKKQNKWYYIYTNVDITFMEKEKVINCLLCNASKIEKLVVVDEKIEILKYYHNETLFKREIEKLWMKYINE